MTCSLGSVSNCGPARFSEDFLPLRASNTCAWATLLTHLPDLDDGVLAAGHAAPDPELVVLGVHGDDLEVPDRDGLRSEEHTSELQSRQYLVCRLLLEKKKTAMDDRSARARSSLYYVR